MTLVLNYHFKDVCKVLQERDSDSPWSKGQLCLLFMTKVKVSKFKVPSLQHNRHHVQVLPCPLHISLKKLGLGEHKMLINWLLLLLYSIKFFFAGSRVGVFLPAVPSKLLSCM